MDLGLAIEDLERYVEEVGLRCELNSETALASVERKLTAASAVQADRADRLIENMRLEGQIAVEKEADLRREGIETAEANERKAFRETVEELHVVFTKATAGVKEHIHDAKKDILGVFSEVKGIEAALTTQFNNQEKAVKHIMDRLEVNKQAARSADDDVR